MKPAAILAAGAATLTSASPILEIRQSSDTENGWGSCADLAVIFARGTFDSGNIGPWVGAPFRDALFSKHNSVAFQGVDAGAYPADLAGYILEGGSNSCASSLAAAVNDYASTCPDSKIVISGWSQGALCARKSFGELNGDAAFKVGAFVAFGDPYDTWQSGIEFPALPDNTEYIGFCKSAPTDPLCGSSADNVPTDPAGFIDYLKQIWANVDQASMNDAQKASLGSIILELPQQAVHQLDTLVRDIANGNLRRWLLTPEHFWYGMDGSTSQAADRIVGLL